MQNQMAFCITFLLIKIAILLLVFKSCPFSVAEKWYASSTVMPHSFKSLRLMNFVAKTSLDNSSFDERIS